MDDTVKTTPTEIVETPDMQLQTKPVGIKEALSIYEKDPENPELGLAGRILEKQEEGSKEFEEAENLS